MCCTYLQENTNNEEFINDDHIVMDAADIEEQRRLLKLEQGITLVYCLVTYMGSKSI